MAKLKANKPTADVLMNSMRAMGYSFEAAIADIVDNSVSAQARNIVLRFPIDPSDCCVAVCDDGIGMNKKELLDAMKYGSQLKSANRSEDDLGRFGLGMKAASLSQCRRLTVASKRTVNFRPIYGIWTSLRKRKIGIWLTAQRSRLRKSDMLTS